MRTAHVICLRGIGEKLGWNTLYGSQISAFPRDDGRFIVHDLPWSASYGPVPQLGGESYDTAVARGMDMISDEVRSIPDGDMIFLAGYSAGATTAGNWAARAPKEWVDRITAVFLIADPMRPYDGGAKLGLQTLWEPGFGIGGERKIERSGLDVHWFSDRSDVITACDANSPLRTVADQTFAMSLRPGEFPRWIRDLAARALEGRWQKVVINWRNPREVLALYAKAKYDLDGYLRRGDHTSYGIRNVPGGNPITYTQAVNRIAMQYIWGEILD